MVVSVHTLTGGGHLTSGGFYGVSDQRQLSLYHVIESNRLRGVGS